MSASSSSTQTGLVEHLRARILHKNEIILLLKGMVCQDRGYGVMAKALNEKGFCTSCLEHFDISVCSCKKCYRHREECICEDSAVVFPVAENRLVIQPSTIPNAGRGLFATWGFQKGHLITRYAGETIDHKEAMRRRAAGKDRYIRSVFHMHEYIDGITDPLKFSSYDHAAGYASFANDGGHSGFKNNAEFVNVWDERQAKAEVWLKAIEDIGSEQEIFVSYGHDYWKPSEAEEKKPRAVTCMACKKSRDSADCAVIDCDNCINDAWFCKESCYKKVCDACNKMGELVFCQECKK